MKLVPPLPKKETSTGGRRVQAARDAKLLVCSRCGSCTAITIETGARHNGKSVLVGTKERICAFCFVKGKISPMC